MTTIAYKSGILAFDTAAVGGSTYAGKVTKALDLSDRVVAAAGAVQDVAAFLDWQSSGGALEHRSKFFMSDTEVDLEAIIIKKEDRSVYMCENSLYPYQIETKFAALGSGGLVALGAMYMGASAIKAVEIAAIVDVYTNSDVKSIMVLPQTTKSKRKVKKC